MARPELKYLRPEQSQPQQSPPTPGAFQGPPRACMICLFGLCHLCNGRVVVHDLAAGTARDEACEHRHRRGRGPVARVLATVPAADVLRRAEA